MPPFQNSLLLHAPNVHTGGGLVLLREILSTKKCSIRWAQLDERTKSLKLSTPLIKHYVRNTIFSRFLAEWRVWYKAKSTDTVLCLHGLPPLFPVGGRVVIFLQNRILLEKNKLVDAPLKTKIRIFIERLWVKRLQRSAYCYIVQTPSMALAAKKYLRHDLDVIISPFAPSQDVAGLPKKGKNKKKFDFLYVASGEGHKNHLNLLEAWRLLNNEGLTPSLALTVSPKSYPLLANKIEKNINELGLNIVNFEQIETPALFNLYQSSSALIFPSFTESFGLPLIEATQHGIPILASERDFVRDVATPVQTFDPASPVSIARAVRRFLGVSESLVVVRSADDFLKVIMT